MNTSSVLRGLPTRQDPMLCESNCNSFGDRLALQTDLRFVKPPEEGESITFHKMKAVWYQKVYGGPCNSYVHELRVVLIKHDPEETREITSSKCSIVYRRPKDCKAKRTSDWKTDEKKPTLPFIKKSIQATRLIQEK